MRGVTVISRLRCDAALWSLPPVVDPDQKKGRGRPPKYGKDRIDLARRAAQTRGWQTGLFSLYGRLVVKKYKTFLATYKPVGGVIRVALVREPDRWVAYSPGARQLVRRFRDQAALRTGSGNAHSGRAPSRRQASSSPFRRAASSAAKASTPCGDQLIPWCLQRADTAQSLYFSTRVLAIHNPAHCSCW